MIRGWEAGVSGSSYRNVVCMASDKYLRGFHKRRNWQYCQYWHKRLYYVKTKKSSDKMLWFVKIPLVMTRLTILRQKKVPRWLFTFLPEKKMNKEVIFLLNIIFICSFLRFIKNHFRLSNVWQFLKRQVASDHFKIETRRIRHNCLRKVVWKTTRQISDICFFPRE